VKTNRAKVSAGKNKPPPGELLLVAYFYLEFMMARMIFPFDFINDKSLPDNIPILLTKIIMHARRERQIIIKELVI